MDPAKLKVIELRAELLKRCLDTKGNKPALVERLRKALETENETGNGNIEKIDTGELSDSEKLSETVRQPQTPRTPSRSSRSSSVTATTPVKLSTRAAQKTPLTPQSAKQLSPSKIQNVERSNLLSTISETESQDSIESEGDNLASLPEKELIREDQSDTIQNEITSNVTTIVQSPKKEMNLSESTQKLVVDSSIKSDLQPTENIESTIDETESKSQISQKETSNNDQNFNLCSNEVNIDKEENPCNESTSQIINENVTGNECHQNADPEVEMQDLNVEKESVVDDVEDSKETVENYKIDTIASDSSITSKHITEEAMEADITECKEHDVSSEEKETIKEQDIEEVSAMDVEKSEIICTSDNILNSDQNVLDKKDILSNVVTKDNELIQEAAQSDRKRKRSSSPSDDYQKCVITVEPEDEPQLNYKDVVLSWYDSDLNLKIDKENFTSATPMHNDGFCYIWAGARASYGVSNGKVYYEAKITEKYSVNIQHEDNHHSLRVGWSVSQASLQLGEDKLSYGYENVGQKCTNSEFMEYGEKFDRDDIVGCYLDMSEDKDITLTFTVNGRNMGNAFTISKTELGDKALFPHIISKNCTFACNFGQSEPWSTEILDNYKPITLVDVNDRIQGIQRPEGKEHCEIILMCGLPGSGKTTWAMKHAAEYPDKCYNIIGVNTLINKMKVLGVPLKNKFQGQWDIIVDKCSHAVNRLLEIACTRRRNIIIDHANVYSSAQRRKMRTFSGYQRKAVVLVPTEEDYKSRLSKHQSDEGNNISDSSLSEMKASFNTPVVGEFFDSIEWVELNEEEGKKLIEKYNKTAKEAGFGQQQTSKRPRFERSDNRDSRDSRNNRDNRDHRDYRDRRSNYSDRNRNSGWRGSGNWRDRPQRGYMRPHSGGYGSPGGWRGVRGPIPPQHRVADRRSNNSDRRGNDRNRSSRQGSWGMSGYQGSQMSGWHQQGNWQGGQGSWQSGQGNYGQSWNSNSSGGSWKGYGQNSGYGQGNYQTYGNGNWNNWSNQQQYYPSNQYWDQQPQSGQTAAAGGQAANVTESVTPTTNSTSSTYNYSEDWRGYADDYNYPEPSSTSNVQQPQHHK